MNMQMLTEKLLRIAGVDKMTLIVEVFPTAVSSTLPSDASPPSHPSLEFEEQHPMATDYIYEHTMQCFYSGGTTPYSEASSSAKTLRSNLQIIMGWGINSLARASGWHFEGLDWKKILEIRLK
jgi:hypothetical protein